MARISGLILTLLLSFDAIANAPIPKRPPHTVSVVFDSEFNEDECCEPRYLEAVCYFAKTLSTAKETRSVIDQTTRLFTLLDKEDFKAFETYEDFLALIKKAKLKMEIAEFEVEGKKFAYGRKITLPSGGSLVVNGGSNGIIFTGADETGEISFTLTPKELFSEDNWKTVKTQNPNNPWILAASLRFKPSLRLHKRVLTLEVDMSGESNGDTFLIGGRCPAKSMNHLGGKQIAHPKNHEAVYENADRIGMKVDWKFP